MNPFPLPVRAAPSRVDGSPMVWCHGDPTVEAFAVLANGPWRDDHPPVAVYDLATVGSERPAPWRGDAARLLASLIAARPDLRDDIATIAARW
nr:hypothetical protein [Planctomycetota bacterium]